MLQQLSPREFKLCPFKLQKQTLESTKLWTVVGSKFLNSRELYENDLRGKVPKELGKLKALISMDLYGNKLEGKIPKSFGKLKSLKFL